MNWCDMQSGFHLGSTIWARVSVTKLTSVDRMLITNNIIMMILDYRQSEAS